MSQLLYLFYFSVNSTAFFFFFSSDELNAYLTKRRPDLCILEGEEEGHRGEDEFVLIEDNEEEENFLQRRCSSGEDWEVSRPVLIGEDTNLQQEFFCSF